MFAPVTAQAHDSCFVLVPCHARRPVCAVLCMRRTLFRFCTCHTSYPSFAHVHIPTPFCACPTYLNRFRDCRIHLSHYCDLHTYLSRYCDCHTRLSNFAHVTNAFSVLVPLTRHANLLFYAPTTHAYPVSRMSRTPFTHHSVHLPYPYQSYF